jgi:hypothetical protein
MASSGASSRAALRTTPRKTPGRTNVQTNGEPHYKRLDLRLTPTESEALDLLVLRWEATRSQIVRSLIVGATLGELDRLDALDAIEPSFDALVDVPSIDDVLADP